MRVKVDDVTRSSHKLDVWEVRKREGSWDTAALLPWLHLRCHPLK